MGLIISIFSCEKNERANNSERKSQDKNSEIIAEKFSCNEGQNDIFYAVSHFKEIQKVNTLNDSGDWRKVQYGTSEGYIYKNRLIKVKKNK